MAPIVLVHRAGGTAAEWDEVAAIVRREEPAREVVAVDLPGRGGSGHPGTVEGLAEHVADRIVGMGEGPAVVAGHSMGGAVAVQAAVDFPAWVRGLVLVASGVEARIARGVLRALENGEIVSQMGLMISSAVTGTRREEMVRRLGRVGAGVLRADLEAAGKLDLAGRLGEVGVPVRIVTGREDRLVSVRKARILGERLGAVVRVVEGAAHMLVWEAPEIVAGEIVEMARRVDAA